MATATFQIFWPRLPSSRYSNSLKFHASLASLSPSSSSLKLCCSTAFLKKGNERFPRQPIASSEGFPSELVEDSKFVPLNADDPVYGPPALLLLGFDADEMDMIKNFLRELDGEFLKVIYCTEDMMKLSVWDAMHIEQCDLEDVKIAKSLPRICFLSGLSGEEMMMFVDAFPETGLKPAVFAALVPNSADKLLGDVIEEIMGDHEMLSGKQSS
ncbi:uncharacterized protein LOC103718601 isoform X1 [Phoenix dactylifera]|uniref:Uncharacterized protein LOC103718601 isoform X1 n=1 Tax=Phoenix dactylifera TaxID=42345 RepID=A0A8B7CTI2_PHODC|nr:uncharacterized protein LOC103718601 isoform X1 [Phoenix dactylifera]